MNTLLAKQALLPEGWRENVRIEVDAAGRIASVTPDSAGPADHLAGIVLPAPANLHSHAFQRAMAGLSEARGPAGRDSFWTWRQLMFRFLDRLDPEDVEAITAFAQIEMLEAGFATVAEFHYLHHAPGGRPYDDPAELSARIAAAAETTGIGLTLVPVLYQYGGCDGQDLAPGQVRFGNNFDQYQNLVAQCSSIESTRADWRLGLSAHSLRAVTPADAARLPALLPGAPVHMHLAEQPAEVAEVSAAYGAHPVDLALDRIGLDPRWVLIHSTQMDSNQTRRLAATGAVAGLCPVTEASLGDGIFDGVTYAEAGGHFGIGTDSNIRISLAEELRQLEYSQRLRDRGRAMLASATQSTGRRLYEAALAGGAQAAGRQSGALAPGLWADMIALDGSAPDLAGRHGDLALDAFVFARGDAISDVWSAGRHVVRAGRHVARDAVAARYARRLAAILEKT